MKFRKLEGKFFATRIELQLNTSKKHGNAKDDKNTLTSARRLMIETPRLKASSYLSLLILKNRHKRTLLYDYFLSRLLRLIKRHRVTEIAPSSFEFIKEISERNSFALDAPKKSYSC